MYAAYGDSIVVWDAATGTEVSRTVVPNADNNGVPLCNNGSTVIQATDPDVVCYANNKWQTLRIASLLLYGDRVTTVVQSDYRIRDTQPHADRGNRKLYNSSHVGGCRAFLCLGIQCIMVRNRGRGRVGGG